jgi:hypothetical protein
MVSLLKKTPKLTLKTLRLAALAAAGMLMMTAVVQVQPCFGQATTAAGTIQGTISDAKGAALPNATVTITSLDTNVTKVITTDGAGFYSAGSLVPASYKVSVTAPGFSTTTETLVVQIGNAANGSVKLSVGGATEQVEVSADAVAVNTTQSTVDGVLTAEQIDSLPISGRNFLDLAQLEPGVQLQSGETFDPTKAGYSSISINGVNGRTARILLDGQDISDETVGTTTLNVSQGSIEEFDISRSSLDISNELTSSGSVTVSTRTGTNKVHGQAFGLFRDQRAGAADGPGGTAYPFQKNQFGGRLGGPILKDKLFIFGTSERIKQDSNNAVQVAAPFSALSGGYTSPFRDNYDAGRMDYNAPKGIHLFFRGAYENNLDDSTFGYGFSRYGNKDNTFAFASGADFVTGKFTHSLRWSYLKFHNLIADQSASGVPNIAPGVELFFSNQGLITGPNLLAPQQTYQSDKQVRYDAGFTLHAHQLQFGVSLNRILGGGFASFFGFAPELAANFGAGPVGGGSASDPTAYSTSYIVMGNGEGYSTENKSFNNPAGGQGDYRFGAYLGDTWKVSSKLTVNYGLRYSRDTGRTDSDLAPIPCSAAVAAFGSASPCTTGNLLDSLIPGLGARVRQPNEDFGPKAGFAYDLRGNGKTIIRAGAGLYFENSIFNNVLFDRPAKLAKGLFFGSAYVPAGTKSVNLPNGTTITTIDGQSIASLWGEPISATSKAFGDLEKAYQAATKSAGAASNGNYVANGLCEGPCTGLSLYAPNYQVARSIQINVGVQREVWKNGVFSADYIRNVGDHFQEAIDANHVGDAKYFNKAAAQHAITATLAACKVATIDEALSACPGLYTDPQTGAVSPATMTDFAANGLDSGNSLFTGYPAAAFGSTPNTGAAFAGKNPLWGHMGINYPMGRSVYNGLQTNFRQNSRLPIPGLVGSNFEVSYTLSRFISTGGTDQNFTPTAVDNNQPNAYAGPAGIDRTHQFSYGGTFGWKHGLTSSIIGHYYSALPTTLTLDPNGAGPGEIFSSDLTGDGTTGDILTGYKAGAFMRSVKPGDLAKVISNWNATGANKLTPAGSALVSSGLFTPAEMTTAGAVTRTIAAPPANNAGNGSLRTFDFVLTRPTKVKWLGEGTSIEPSVSFFNLFNFSNFGTYTDATPNSSAGGSLLNVQQSGTVDGTDTSLSSRGSLRTGNGSGVFSQGAARILEYGLKINF